MNVGEVWRTDTGKIAHVTRRMNTEGQYSVHLDGNRFAKFIVYRTGTFVRGTIEPTNLVERAARVYISGPMTGYPESNYPAFDAAAADYRKRGNFVINPAELHPRGPIDIEKQWHEYMRVDIAALMTCEVIIMLDGWTKSKGARLEHHNARELGFAICYPSNEIF